MPEQNKPAEKYFVLNEKQLQAIGNYLVARPYGEVAQFIDILKNAQPVDVTFAQPPSPVDLPAAPGEDTPPEATKTEQA